MSAPPTDTLRFDADPAERRPDAEGRSEAERRFDRLAAGVSGLRRRTPRFDNEQSLLLVGSVLAPLGLLCILLGWYGAAHTPRLFEQIPYLISGGLLGAALVAAGGFLYFGYWLTRIVHEGRDQTRQVAELLTRLDGRLASLEAAAAPSSSNGNGAFVATATGTMFHRPDCSIVAGKRGLVDVSRSAASRRKPCQICNPA